MNRALHIGVVLVVVMHMVCGCCLHHAHASGSHTDLSISVNAVCSCEQHAHPQEGQPSDHRSGDQDCDDDQCVFTLLGSGNASLVAVGADSLSFISDVSSLPEMNGIDTVGTPSRHGGPLLPLHLLNQALLL